EDAFLTHERVRDHNGLPRIGLAVLEDILQRPTIDAATRVDLIEGVVEALFPLGTVLRILAGQGSGHPDINRFLGRRLGVGKMCQRGDGGCHRKGRLQPQASLRPQTGYDFLLAWQQTPRPSAARLAGLCSNCRKTRPNSTDGDRIAAGSKGPSICGIPIEAVKNGAATSPQRGSTALFEVH